MKRLVWVMVACLMALPAQAVERFKALPTDKDNAEMSEELKPTQEFDLDTFLRDPSMYHWVGFYMAAQKLFAMGRKDEAVMWYYAGQIRARVSAGLDPDPSRNNALLSSLSYGIGRPINEYAGSDIDNWVKQIDAALAWDNAHPITAKGRAVIGIEDVAFDVQNFKLVYAQVREGLKAMRDELASDPETIKRQRRANGIR